MRVLAPLLIVMASITGACGASEDVPRANDVADDDVRGQPSDQQIEQALSCVERKVGHRLPRPESLADAPEMTDTETDAHLACVFELHLEDVFISPAGIESLDLARRIAARNRRERTCMTDKGWVLIQPTDAASPVAIAKRPAGDGAESRLRRDLVACGIPQKVIEEGFGE